MKIKVATTSTGCLDYYNENGEYIGYKSREDVHREGLWHKTVHCWLYDKEGNCDSNCSPC